MKARQLPTAARLAFQCRYGLSFRERKLRLLSHTLILVLEQLSEFVRRALRESLAQESLHLGHGRVFEAVRREELVDAPAVRPDPRIDPIAEIESAVGAEFAIRGQRRAHQLLA